MDTFSKLTPPNAIRIRVDIFTDEETNEFAHMPPRPRSSHITDIDTDNRVVDVVGLRAESLRRGVPTDVRRQPHEAQGGAAESLPRALHPLGQQVWTIGDPTE